MEKLINIHIRNNISLRFPIHHTQYAYQAGKSTELAIHQLVTNIERTLEAKEFALAAFIDIEGAFDNTGYDAILRALSRRNVETATCRWITNMLSTRVISSKLGSQSRTIQSTKGCPQGGVLSPLLWTLVVDELLNLLEANDINAIGYADDIAIYVTGPFEDTVRSLMENALRTTKNWCSAVGLTVNPTKTTLVPFTRKTKLNGEPFCFEGVEIPYSTHSKYLGVTLDTRLNWKEHLDCLYNKAIRALWASSSYCNRNWGIKPKLMNQLYCTMVRPIVTYAAWIWWPKADQINAATKLNRIQRLACLQITGAMRTAPTSALEAIIGLTPITIHVKREALASALRHAILDKTSRITGHSRIVKEIPNWERLRYCTDIGTVKLDFEKPFTITILERDEWTMDKLLLEANTQTWYTDGSKMDTGTGSGIYGPNTRISVSLGKSSSIFQAELEAIRMCGQHLLNRKPKGQRFAILSDSQAAIRAIHRVGSSSRLVQECVATLKELSTHNKVRICWVPGHSEVDGNEVADELARGGAATKFIGPEPQCGINWSTVIGEVEAWTASQRKTYWDNQGGLRQSKELIIPYKERGTLDLSKRELRLLTGYLTGHNCLRYHRHNIGLADNVICRLCASGVETSVHMLGHCEALSRSRYLIYGKSQVDSEEIKNTPIRDLMKIIRAAERLLEGQE